MQKVLVRYLGCQKRAKQRGRMVERSEERVNDKRPRKRVSISVEKIKNKAERHQIGKPQEETVSKDIGSRTSAVYTNVFPHKLIKY